LVRAIVIIPPAEIFGSKPVRSNATQHTLELRMLGMERVKTVVLPPEICKTEICGSHWDKTLVQNPNHFGRFSLFPDFLLWLARARQTLCPKEAQQATP
jgi:hypothetical protein